MHIDTANYTPFAPNGWRGIHQGAAIVFFAYIGFDAISTAAEETKNPQRNMPIGILGGLAICTVIYVIVGIVATGLVPYQQLKAADPLAHALELAGLPIAGWFVAFGAVVSLTAVLLVFQYGQPRIFFAMARDGLLPALGGARFIRSYRTPHVTTRGHRPGGRARQPRCRRERDLRPHEHRHARARSPWSAVGVLVLRVQGAAPPAAVPGAVRLAGGALPAPAACLYVMGPSDAGVGAVRLLAGGRPGPVFRVRRASQSPASRRDWEPGDRRPAVQSRR